LNFRQHTKNAKNGGALKFKVFVGMMSGASSHPERLGIA